MRVYHSSVAYLRDCSARPKGRKRIRPESCLIACCCARQATMATNFRRYFGVAMTFQQVMDLFDKDDLRVIWHGDGL